MGLEKHESVFHQVSVYTAVRTMQFVFGGISSQLHFDADDSAKCKCHMSTASQVQHRSVSKAQMQLKSRCQQIKSPQAVLH